MPICEWPRPTSVEDDVVVLEWREAEAAHGEHDLPTAVVMGEAVQRAKRRGRRWLVVGPGVVGLEGGVSGAQDGIEGGRGGFGLGGAVIGADKGEAVERPPCAYEGERALDGTGEGHGARVAWKWNWGPGKEPEEAFLDGKGSWGLFGSGPDKPKF